MSDPAAVDAKTRALEGAVEALARRWEGAAAEPLQRAPTPGEWSATEVLVHVVEYLPYWARVAREVAAREVAGIPFGRTHDDPARIAAVAEHARDPLAAVIPRIRESLRECVALLRTIPPERWTRSGRHGRRGEMTVEEVIDHFLLRHTEEHAAQAEAAMGARPLSARRS